MNVLLRMNQALLASALVAATMLVPASAASAVDATCSRPQSNAESLALLNVSQFSDPNLTIAVQVHPQADPEYVAAIYDAIDTWNAVLADCLDGAVTLTLVQKTAKADILIRYLPHWSGINLFGVSICTPQRCMVFGRSDAPPGYTALTDAAVDKFYYMIIHEIGHALGLGHAQPIEATTDVMGYGWVDPGAPDAVISQCDVNALAYVWSAYLAGTEPASTFDC